MFFKFLSLVRVFVMLMVCCSLLSACGNPQWLLCTSSGILSYNRHTGVLEVLWESSVKQDAVRVDTIYLEKSMVDNSESVR